MFRTSVTRIHRIILERTHGAWPFEKVQQCHSQYPSYMGNLNAPYLFRGIVIQSEDAGGLCVEKRAATPGDFPGGESSLPKRTAAESGGTELLKSSLFESKYVAKSVVVNPVFTEQVEDVPSGNHKEECIRAETADHEQCTQAQLSTHEPNLRVGQGKVMLEASSLVKGKGQNHQLLDVNYSVRSSSTTDDEDMERLASLQASALLQAALDAAEEEAGSVRKEDQRSLRVAVVGAPNAGKSLLTNKLVGSRVSAVSRKTNTTHREHLGVYTKGDTQLCFYDTPGLHLDIEGSPLRVDARSRVQSAWQTVDSCEAVVVLVDAERQIRRPDRRVKRLVEKIGMEQVADQKKVLCLNKVDLIEQKRLLLPLAKEFENLPAYDRIYMISGLTGSGVNDVKDYLLQQAIVSPWEEDADYSNHRDVALEVVREQVFEHLHEELPHMTKQKLVSWKVLKDGSVRIQQVLTVAKKEHQKILVGKNGAVIGEIGIKARKELSTILGVNVHLVLDVKVDGTE